MEEMEIVIHVKINQRPRYSEGAVYCSKCAASFYPEPKNIYLHRCLFCGGQLRRRPRRRVEKERYIEIKEVNPDEYLFSE